MMLSQFFHLQQRRLMARPLQASIRMYSAAAQSFEDDDSVPENLREDRTLLLAQTSPSLKNDPILNELLNKEHSLSSLQNFYNIR